MTPSMFSGGETSLATKENMKQRAKHDRNIQNILLTNAGEWGSLYNHPKLMCMYY